MPEKPTGKPKKNYRTAPVAPVGRPVVWTDAKLDELADAMLAYYEENTSSLFLEDFCAANGLWPQRISEFELKCPKLAEVRKKVDTITTSRLANLGIKGTTNPALTIFALKQKGWKDKQEVAHSGEMGLSISYSEVADRG